MPAINFHAQLFTINTWTIILLPKAASLKLPSRGITMVKGTFNGVPFQTALEPDGNGSHWFKVDSALANEAGVKVGDSLTVSIEATKDWPEPDVPTDIIKALEANHQAHETWRKVTTMARWEWIRWIRATSNDQTRKRRIEVACSKLQNGMRRPCCFNASMCTEPSVSKGGVLLEPAMAKS